VTVAAHACPTCTLAVPQGFSFCPRCRAKAEGRAWDPGEVDRHERQYVLSLVVLSLGALALPRLWRSPAFSPAGKVAVSLVGLLNTGGVVVILWALFAHGIPYLVRYAGLR
jgi:hypothetical protein